jgi:hypothetical protein
MAADVGAEKNGMSWGLVWEDFDNDGDLDMFIVNSYGYDITKSFYYENDYGLYKDKAAEYGLDYAIDFYGAACADFNNDGSLDIFASATNGENKYLVNTKASKGNWAKLTLHGLTINSMAIGVRVKVVAGGQTYIRNVTAGNGYISQMSQTLHFGIGSATVIDQMEIFWKKGYTQKFTNVAVNKAYSITEGGNPVTSAQIGENVELPSEYSLKQNYPNPFNPTTVISYQLPVISNVSLKIYDLIGKEIATLVNEEQSAGWKEVQWNASNVASGVYFVRFQAGAFVETKKMVVLQ